MRPVRLLILVGGLVALSVGAWAAFVFWGPRPSQDGMIPSSSFVQKATTPTSGFVTAPDASPSSPVSHSPSPTPRPTGPGEYACDPYGVCNRYADAARKQYCTVTFADRQCLDQCGKKEMQCAQ